VLDRKDEYVKAHNPYYTAEVQSRLLSYGQERYGTNTWLRKKREDGTKILDKAAQIQWFMPNVKDISL
jgi:virulence-associated protein VapD